MGKWNKIWKINILVAINQRHEHFYCQNHFIFFKAWNAIWMSVTQTIDFFKITRYAIFLTIDWWKKMCENFLVSLSRYWKTQSICLRFVLPEARKKKEIFLFFRHISFEMKLFSWWPDKQSQQHVIIFRSTPQLFTEHLKWSLKLQQTVKFEENFFWKTVCNSKRKSTVISRLMVG